MKYALILLVILSLASGLFLTACAAFQKETQAVSSDGTPLFTDNLTGVATDKAVDATGKPNAPLMHYSSTGAAEGLVKTGGLLPPPFGSIIEAVGGVGLAGLALYFRRKNAATDAAIAEYESKIRAKPEAAKAVDEHVWDNLSPATVTKLLPIKAAV